jgi:CheY-like chemotaxis protein
MNNHTEVEVLLVEDNPRDAEMTLRTLHKRNLANQILHVSDGQEALDWLFGTGAYAGRNPSHLPKLALVDLKLPKVDGLDVLRAIRADERTKLVPVVSGREFPAEYRFRYQLH